MSTSIHMLPRTKRGIATELVDSVKEGADQVQPVKKKLKVYRSSVPNIIFCCQSIDFSFVYSFKAGSA